MTEAQRGLEPTAALWEWQMEGACRSASPDIFFHPEAERGQSRARRVQRAKAICGTCPVLEQCRAHALAVREPYGVWGGLTEDERDAIYRATAAEEAGEKAS